jgi:hypothetical protein
MLLYQAFRTLIESNIPLLELNLVEAEKADYSFYLLSGCLPQLTELEWKIEWLLPDGSGALLSARLGSGFVMRFANLADFVISADSREIHCYPQENIPQETIRHLFLDQVLPCLLWRRDRFVIHASAVVINGQGVSFLGKSGRGKSTLSASLSRAGYPLLTDDSLLLQKRGEEIHCVPSYSGVRLWPESVSTVFGEAVDTTPVAHYFDKKRLDAKYHEIPYVTSEVKLRKIYLLDPYQAITDKNKVTITRLSLANFFPDFFESIYRLTIVTRDRIKEEFDLISFILGSVPVALLSFPHDYSMLPELHEMILTDLETADRSRFCDYFEKKRIRNKRK